MDYQHGGDIYTYEGMLDFSSNINPFGPPPSVVEAVRLAAEQIGVYPDPQCRELRVHLAEQSQIPAECFVFGNGVADLIFAAALAQKPKKAVLTAPSFSEYAQALRSVGCCISYYDLKEEENFRLSESFLNCLTEEVDMVFLCSPDNPTGNVIRKELLLQIAGRCKEKGIRMILDESFCDFQENQGEVLSGKEVREFSHLFLLRSFTKMYAMPGLRLGYGISQDREFLEKMEQFRQPWSVSNAAQAAGLAALSEKELPARTRAYVSEERKRMEEKLRQLGISCFPSEANYILLKSERDLFELLKERRILIRDCENYVGLGKGYYRIAVKRREENERLLKALSEIMACVL